MKMVNEALIEDLQNLSHSGENCEILVGGALDRGRIVMSNGRIKYAQSNRRDGRGALEDLVLTPNAKHTVRRLLKNTKGDGNETDFSANEVVIPLLVSLENQQEGAAQPDDSPTEMVPSRHAVADFRLYDIMMECHKPGWDDNRFYLHQGRNLIGRSEHCHIQIEDESVSRIHAVISVSSHAVELEDFQSTNGSLVNGAMLMKGELQDGDKLGIGNVPFKIIFRLKRRGTKSEAGADRKNPLHFMKYAGLKKQSIGITKVLHALLGKITLMEVWSMCLRYQSRSTYRTEINR